MKRHIFIILSMMICISIQGQSKKFFCEIKGIEKELSAGLKIVFDFGNNPVYSIWGSLKSKQKLVDEKGDEISFNSMVDAANYMVDKGWIFQQAYTGVYGGNPVHHWIFFKEAENKEKASEGIMTKEQFDKLKKNHRTMNE